MKKIIYGNVVFFLLLVVFPWYLFDQEYYWDIFNFDRNYLVIFALFAAGCLALVDVVVAIKSKGGNRKTALWCALPPFLLVAQFVLAYFFAFSGFTGF